MARVLIAENNAELLAVISKVLRLSGHDVVGVNTGTDAICLLRALPQLDLFILDILLPGVDGNEVLRELGTSAPPLVLVISGEETALGAEERTKVHRFLPKPFDLSAFLVVVAEMLGAPHPIALDGMTATGHQVNPNPFRV